jgi:hypothetical protein
MVVFWVLPSFSLQAATWKCECFDSPPDELRAGLQQCIIRLPEAEALHGIYIEEGWLCWPEDSGYEVTQYYWDNWFTFSTKSIAIYSELFEGISVQSLRVWAVIIKRESRILQAAKSIAITLMQVAIQAASPTIKEN